MCFREYISFRLGANDIYDVMVLLGTVGCLSPIRFIRNYLTRLRKRLLDVRLAVLVGGYLDRVGKVSRARLRSVEALEATVPRRTLALEIYFKLGNQEERRFRYSVPLSVVDTGRTNAPKFERVVNA